MRNLLKNILIVIAVFGYIKSGVCQIKNGVIKNNFQNYNYVAFIRTEFRSVVRSKREQGWKFRGSGTIISNRWILTCAHIFFYPDQKQEANFVDVIVGTPEVTDCPSVPVDQVRIHRNYNIQQSTNGYDIALVRCDTSYYTINYEASFMPLPPQQKEDLNERNCETSGWGNLKPHQETNELYTAAVKITDNVEGEEDYNVYNFEDKLSVIDRDTLSRCTSCI